MFAMCSSSIQFVTAPASRIQPAYSLAIPALLLHTGAVAFLRGATVDLTGCRFGRLVVLRRYKKKDPKYKRRFWLCQCDCGKQKVAHTSSLRKLDCRSCGCLSVGAHKTELAGQKFGRLLAVDYAHTSKSFRKAKSGSAWWNCKCDCGKSAVVTSHALRSGGTRSCGCLQREDTHRRLTINMAGQKYGRLTIIKEAPKEEGRGGSVRWVCKCDCGTECVKNGSSIREGWTKSCGCLIGEHKRKKFGESDFNSIFRGYQEGAKSRRLQFSLTFEQFRQLTSCSCYYCGAPPSNRRKRCSNSYGQLPYNGIDRKDNSLGYTVDNSVPCCKNCNYGKRTQSHDEFILWVRRVCSHTLHHSIKPMGSTLTHFTEPNAPKFFNHNHQLTTGSLLLLAAGTPDENSSNNV